MRLLVIICACARECADTRGSTRTIAYYIHVIAYVFRALSNEHARERTRTRGVSLERGFVAEEQYSGEDLQPAYPLKKR